MLTSPVSRRAGLLVPLFSMPSSSSWGIGEIGDVATMATWMSGAGFRLLQLLPINEVPAGERSPYSALSAMAIDPQFVSLRDVEDFVALGGEDGMDDHERMLLRRARAAVTVDYASVRELKERVLRRSFSRFFEQEWTTGSARAVSFQRFIEVQSWWLDDYSLFRSLHARYHRQSWTEWPEPISRRDSVAMASARVELADDILYRQYVQWVAGDQWSAARRACGAVALFGDLPFMVSGNSADVWARQGEFRLDTSVGVPPDAFSATGQDWNFPAYDWPVVAHGDYGWLRDRARRNAELFDGYRIDHVVGFYRTYFRTHDARGGCFTPEGEIAQVEQGEQVLRVLREPGAIIVVEDLGVIPEFVRDSLARQGIAGYKVFRWERYWLIEGQPFLDPVDYPTRSVATSGTHDTEPLVTWWMTAPVEERKAILSIPSLGGRIKERDRDLALERVELGENLRAAMLETLCASGSDFLVLPIQDVFGWSDRINQPATISASNWTWRLPWKVDELGGEPEAVAAAAQWRSWTHAYSR